MSRLQTVVPFCAYVAFTFAVAPSSVSIAEDKSPPANSTQVCNETFDSPLDKQWRVNFGDWKVNDGVLTGRQQASDNHAAVVRRTVETSNAVYELRFRLSDSVRALHFGFDPKRGTLDKKGHLFSIVVEPGSWKILKHANKANPKEEPNETLTTETRTFKPGQWYRLRVTTWQQHVTAQIDDDSTLKTSDATFSVAKPTLVFRCIGDGVQIDNVRVWTQNKPSEQPKS